MKKLMFALTVTLAATALIAAPKRKALPATGEDEMVTKGKAAMVNIAQAPRLGSQALAAAPAIGNAQMYYKKPRSWVVLNLVYETFGTDATVDHPRSRFLEQLTFTWHVLLDTKTAKENKGNGEKLPPYSYFTTSVTYFNIPSGQHAASVVLAPSYYERYGEAKAVGVVITNENGEELAGDSWSEIKPVKPGTKFWETEDFQSACGGENPTIIQRQGLVDRSKTIWALSCPNDYEATVQ